MSKKHNRYTDNNQGIAKYTSQLNEAEKSISQRRQRARALCTHTKRPRVPDLVPSEDGNGKMLWYCRSCHECIDLTRINDDELKKAINTISQACNMIKMMSEGTENDRKIIESVIADVQLKINVYIYQAYKSALNASQKPRNNRGNGRRNESSVSWN